MGKSILTMGDMKCGSDDVYAECAGTTINITVNSATNSKLIEQNTKRLVSEVVSIGTFFITNSASFLGEDMSINMQLGINALRCAFLNGFINIYLLIAAAVYVAKQFGQEAQIQTQVDEYYPKLRTCSKDVENLGKYFGGGDNTNFQAC